MAAEGLEGEWLRDLFECCPFDNELRHTLRGYWKSDSGVAPLDVDRNGQKHSWGESIPLYGPSRLETHDFRRLVLRKKHGGRFFKDHNALRDDQSASKILLRCTSWVVLDCN